ncbi:MAG TPA: NepR family anti-sigma factor [Hyphomicrobiaceae bacterium]|nr:NepR family anti-sigma factor [Hyphomicrobiaceae bacterium]
MTDKKRTGSGEIGAAPNSGERRGESPPLSRDAQDMIARRLRETYGANLEEPVPDKFMKLLEQLAKKG